MPWAVLTCIAAVAGAFFTVTGYVQWFSMNKKQTNNSAVLAIALRESERLYRIRLEEESRRKREEEIRKNLVFRLNFLITHGSAFGGCSAILRDGRYRKGSVALEDILMHGRHSSGKEYTFYIEESDIRICACDDPDSLLVLSDGMPFVIRESGMGRGEGETVTRALIRKDVLYYLILETKHEISIVASAS